MASEDQKENAKLNWTTEMDNCMLEVFLEHLAQGRKTPQGWKRFTYNAVREALKANLGANVTISHIENRIKTMRRHTIVFKKLKTSFSGFGYDTETGCLTADDQVWDDAIKADYKMKGYRNKPLPRLMAWTDVLGDNVAVGNIQRTSATADEDANIGERYDNSYTPNAFLGDQYTIESPLGQSTQGNYVPLGDDNRNNNTPMSSSTQSGKATKLLPKKRTIASGLKEEFGGMREAIENFVEAVKEKNQYDDKIWDQIVNAIYS